MQKVYKGLGMFLLLLAMFTLVGCNEKTDPYEQAKQVESMITELPADISILDEGLIVAARNAYDLLSEDEKNQISNYAKLMNGETALQNLKNEEAQAIIDQTLAQQVIDEIDNLPEQVLLSHLEGITEARENFEQLTDAQKALVTNIENLEEKEIRLVVLVDEFAANEVNQKIALISDQVLPEERKLIEETREAYEDLTTVQKNLVVGLDRLLEAEALIVTAEDRALARAVELKIGSLPDEITILDEAQLLETIEEFENLSAFQKTFVLETFKNALNEKHIDFKIEKIRAWATEHIGESIVDYVEFVTKDPFYGVDLSWEPSDDYPMDAEGYAYPESEVQFLDIYIRFTIENREVELSIPTSVATYEVADMYYWFNAQFERELIARDYEVRTMNASYPNIEVTWNSSNEEVFNQQGKLIKPYLDTPFHIEFTLTAKDTGIESTFRRNLIASGLSLGEIGDVVEKWIYDHVGEEGVISGDLELPTWFDEFQSSLEWESTDEAVISSTGIYKNPGVDTLVSLIVRIQTPKGTSIIEMRYKVLGEEYEDIWDAIEVFLSFIHKEEITNQRFTMYGVGRNDISHNFGYIPFYDPSPSYVIQGIIPLSLPNRSGYLLDAIKYVTIHDTANVNAGASGHNSWVSSGSATVSWHYTIDDKDIYQHLPDNEVGWHAGTREGNYNSIGIETCINLGVDYNDVMRKTAKKTAELLYRYNLTVNEIRQHYDFSGKNCPQVMREAGRWMEFMNLAKIEYFAQSYLQGVGFTWESLNPTIMNHEGKIINHPNMQMSIGYRVFVNVNGEIREFTFQSTIKPLTFTI